MAPKKSAPDLTGRHPKKGLSLLFSVLFFISLAGLYGTLGTFFSSCGGEVTYSPEATTLLFTYTGPFSCIYPLQWTADRILFEDAVNNGWKLRVNINKADNGTSLKKYDFVNSTTSTGTSGGYLVGQEIKGISIPNNIAYTVNVILQSPCGSCGAGGGQAYFLRFQPLDPYPSGQIVGGTLGALKMWQKESCSLIFN